MTSTTTPVTDRLRATGNFNPAWTEMAELDPAWLRGAGGVLVTAGASAPEHLVNNLLERLRRDFGATVETRTLVEEDVSFEPPKSVRKLAVLN